ncbi:SMI1/KNR4 family protein [Bacillus salacetis]|uniref:SMI1/KNR4 family protein n=1 Tax=Bacillus salacetis TaxID=2315464 RepID=A0A3A1QUB5_9BACI|nr:SMI1/KNR4 family protein [Bacillus salacetis]RIW28940.1 SMI1/KNR4 family protein [Bacillus salacetis]
MWKEFVTAISNEYHFGNPASKTDVTQLQVELNVELTKELVGLFSETNGIFDYYHCPLIWSAKQVLEDNLFFRNFEEYQDLYMPFDNLLFFSDAGNGDLFCYAITKNGTIEKTDIYVWNHEDDSRIWVASSLQDYIEGWLTGRISV